MPGMSHCMVCGHKLIEKELKNEGMIPYCPSCGEYRFPVYSSAVSMIVMDEKKEHILLIRQYGKKDWILVAGYINKGEDGEDAVEREIFEELGVRVKEKRFNHSHYFPPSNTLLWNWTVTIEGDLHPNEEIDEYRWFTLEEAEEAIKKDSLAQAFLLGYLEKNYDFERIERII